MGKIRELADSLDASVHTVVGDDVPTALLDFAREINATQLVIGTSRRSRLGADFRGGHRLRPSCSGPARSTCTSSPTRNPNGGFRRGTLSPRERRVASWLAAVIVPSVICAITVTLLDAVPGHCRRKRTVLHRGAVGRAARRRRARRTFGGAVRAAAELLLDRPAAQLHHRRTQQCHHRIGAAADRGRRRGAGRRRGQARPGKPDAPPRRPNC